MRLKNIFNLSVGNAVYSLSLWINITLLAKLSSLENVGIYTYSMAILSPLFAFFNMNLRTVYVTDIDESQNIQSYNTIRKYFSLLSVIIGISIYLVFKGYNNIEILAALSIAKYFESMSDISYAFYQKQGKTFKIAQSQVMRGLIGCCSFGAMLFYFDNLLYSCLIYAATWVIIYFIFDIRGFPKYQAKKSNDLHLDIIIKALPLGILLAINQLTISMPRFFVESYLGFEFLGIFSGITYLMFIAGIFINSLGQAITHDLAVLFRTNINKYILNLSFAFCIVILIGILGVIIVHYNGAIILQLVYSKEYSYYNNLFELTMIASIALFGSTMIGVGLSATRQFKNQLIVNLPVPIFMVIYYLTYSNDLTMEIAIWGFSYGMTIKFLMQLLLLFIVIKNNFKNTLSKIE